MSNIQASDELFLLSTGQKITSLTQFENPLDEYRSAFIDMDAPFLFYYSFPEKRLNLSSFTRGEFWRLTLSAMKMLIGAGLLKGNRIVHCFSSNSPYDLAFRLAENLLGFVPVTINWEVDIDDTIVYKIRNTEAKSLVYDVGFTARVGSIKTKLGSTFPCLKAEEIEGTFPELVLYRPSLSYDDERIIIFTSGTTGEPKGVSQSHNSYLANRLTFESYFSMSNNTHLDLLLVNPLHHTNSSALSDWGIRRPGAIIHLISRYTTDYWKILADVAAKKRDLLVTSLVSRHMDFLDSLASESRLPVEFAALKGALSKTDILMGSAPVGPTTIKRVLNYSNKLPHVRFGSTETCLEVMATPVKMSLNESLKAFEAGWSHRYSGEDTVGYYIGREHYPYTQVKIVKNIEPDGNDYFRPCELGEPGYLITRGPNVMTGYVGKPETTKAVFQNGWYTGLRDMGFALKNPTDGQLDYYWMSRDSALLIRGGANYAYDQIATELSRFIIEHYRVKPEEFELAVIGLRLGSEHEDSCCVTIEVKNNNAEIESKLSADFIKLASGVVSKGARPNLLRFGIIPKNFKGAILYGQLKKDYADWLASK